MEKLINVSELYTGLKVSKAVFIEGTSVVVLNKDAIIDDSKIATLKKLGIVSVFVYCNKALDEAENFKEFDEEEPPIAPGAFKILVVDDEKDICLYIKEVLENRNYSVVIAHSAAAAWEKLVGDPLIEMIFLDIIMPEIGGFEFLKRVKSQLKRPVNVVMVTARKTMQDVVMAKELGVCGYITKPFDPERLVKVVEMISVNIKVI